MYSCHACEDFSDSLDYNSRLSINVCMNMCIIRGDEPGLGSSKTKPLVGSLFGPDAHFLVVCCYCCARASNAVHPCYYWYEHGLRGSHAILKTISLSETSHPTTISSYMPIERFTVTREAGSSRRLMWQCYMMITSTHNSTTRISSKRPASRASGTNSGSDYKNLV
jgi:hypothetical protein